jgi:hypothetical protein
VTAIKNTVPTVKAYELVCLTQGGEPRFLTVFPLNRMSMEARARRLLTAMFTYMANQVPPGPLLVVPPPSPLDEPGGRPNIFELTEHVEKQLNRIAENLAAMGTDRNIALALHAAGIEKNSAVLHDPATAVGHKDAEPVFPVPRHVLADWVIEVSGGYIPPDCTEIGKPNDFKFYAGLERRDFALHALMENKIDLPTGGNARPLDPSPQRPPQGGNGANPSESSGGSPATGRLDVHFT